MATQQFSPQTMIELANLVDVGQSLIEMLGDSKKVKSFLSEVESLNNFVSQAKDVEKKLNLINSLNEKNAVSLKEIEDKNADLDKRKEALDLAESDLKQKLSVYKKDTEALISARAELDKQISLASAEREAALASRKIADDLAFDAKQKNAELDAKISDVNAKLSKLKEI